MMKSLSLLENRHMVFKAGQGAGASGSFFFFSHDNKFLIKTLKGFEKKILLDMLDDYVAHIINTDNRSLLARIYGVFTVKNNYFADLEIIVMQNTVQLYEKSSSRLIFDMKGSKTGRKAHVSSQDLHTQVLKDLNFLEMNQNCNLVNVTTKQMKEIDSLLLQDSIFLR